MRAYPGEGSETNQTWGQTKRIGQEEVKDLKDRPLIKDLNFSKVQLCESLAEFARESVNVYSAFLINTLLSSIPSISLSYSSF